MYIKKKNCLGGEKFNACIIFGNLSEFIFLRVRQHLRKNFNAVY